MSPQDLYGYLPTLPDGDKIVEEAVKYVGVPYVWAGDDPDGFDCSGLALYVFGRLGVSLQHSSALQATVGFPVAHEELQPGDLLFFYNPVHHVGIYVGNGTMIDAPESGSYVGLQRVGWSNYTGARRIPLASP